MNTAVDLSDGNTFGNGFPHEFFNTLRDSAQPYWHEPTAVTPDGEGFWVISRYRHITEIFRNAAVFSSDKGGSRTKGGTALKDEPSAGKMLNQTDNPHHRRLRDLVQKGFTTRSVAKLESELRERTRSVVRGFIDQQNSAGGDFVPEVARELPLQAICTILGVPMADRAQLVDWVDAGIENNTGDVIAHDYLRLLGRYAMSLIEQKRNEPTEDILSIIIHARLDGDDNPQLSDFELKLFFNLLFPAGAETTRSAMAGAINAFIEFPDQYRRLRAEPDLMRSAVEEIVRWTTPTIYKRRTATRDFEFKGETIREGEKVTVWEMSGNRDQREFDRPFDFDISRWPNRHIGFGAGVHFCLGSQLARLELKLLLEELIASVESFERTGPLEWTPNNRLLGIKSLPVRLVAS